MRIVLLVALTVAARPILAAESDESLKVRALLQKKFDPTGPGAAVSILRDGKVIHQDAIGLARVAQNLPIKPDTTFDLASCSKQFTAMAIMILADRGKLTFDDDVRKYLPEMGEHDLHLRHLLNMTSGLLDYTSFMDLESKNNLDMLHAVARKPMQFVPGAKFDYCNTNYALLALIVERISKQRFAHFMDENIFKPAGMKETGILENPKQPVKKRAMGYTRNKTGIHPARDDTSIFGDGQVMSSVIDMGAWDRALREGKLVKPETLAQAFIAGKLNNGKSCGYGFGWSISRENGHKLAWHAGEWTGTSTYIVRSLDDGLTVIVLSNLQSFDCIALGDEIAAIFRKNEGRGK